MFQKVENIELPAGKWKTAPSHTRTALHATYWEGDGTFTLQNFYTLCHLKLPILLLKPALPSLQSMADLDKI